MPSPDIVRRSTQSVRLLIATLAFLGLAAAASAQPAPAYPFGSHRQPYAAGTIRPTIAASAVDKQTSNFYDLWRAAHLKPACVAGQYYVKADTNFGAKVVSEGQGYGMLIVAMMAGYDPDARNLFDALYRYKLAHPSGIEPDLMEWSQNAACTTFNSSDSATDGDLDIAYALFIADRQWGSAGAIDYAGEGKKMLAAIRRANVNGVTKLVNLGDWVKTADVRFRYATRSSDWMPGHFRAFANREARTVWTGVLDAHLALIARMQENFAENTGLLPDFVVNSQTTTPRPAPANFLEGPHDGHYNYNACRTPWRIGIDAAMSGDPRSVAAARALSSWIRSKTVGRVSAIRSGYYLNGLSFVQYQDMPFIAPFAVAAITDPDAQAWLDALWRVLVTTAPQGYAPDSIRMLSMLAVSRNWIRP